MQNVVVFTIAPKNQLAGVRVLFASVKKWHPDYTTILILIDRPDGHFEPDQEEFHIFPASELGIPTFLDLTLRHDVAGLTAALKPFAFQWIMARQEAEVAVFFEANIKVYSRLDQLEALLQSGTAIVLTPHATAPLESGVDHDGQRFLDSGVFNLGFMAAKRCTEANRFIDWWGQQLLHCANDKSDPHMDQRWCDLAPCYVERLSILRDSGYGATCCNLVQHPLSLSKAGHWQSGGEPLRFFDFSDPFEDDSNDLPGFHCHAGIECLAEATALCNEYRSDLSAAGLSQTRHWPYSFARTCSSRRLDAETRRRYRLTFPRPQYLSAGIADEVVTRLQMPVQHDRKHPIIQMTQDTHQVFESGTRREPRSYRLLQRLDDYVLNAIWRRLPLRYQYLTNRYWYKLLQWTGHDFGVTKLYWLFSGPATIPQPLDDIYVSSLMYMIWSMHPDLKRLYKIDQPGDCRAFIEWFQACAESEYGITPHVPLKSQASNLVAPRISPHGKPGANLIGYPYGEFGMGEQLRLAATACNKAAISISITDVAPPDSPRNPARTWRGTVTNMNPHMANIFHVNADQMLAAYASLGDEYFGGKYNIGYWAWELNECPDAWLPTMGMIDEIWAMSQFVQESFAAKSRLPVIHMPQCIALPKFERMTRARWGLPKDVFFFLTLFDSHSLFSRKNPFDAVRAFKLAFPNDPDVRLVLKTMNADTKGAPWAKLTGLMEGDTRIIVMNLRMDRLEVLAMIDACDCLVSLHRAEGFGLVMAEAMYLGKPVVVTNYSGNTDFTHSDNACLVDYELVPVQKGEFVFHQEGQAWAQPDVDHAAWHMRKVVTDTAYRNDLGAKAHEYIQGNHSPEAIGKRYANRLRTLGFIE